MFNKEPEKVEKKEEQQKCADCGAYIDKINEVSVSDCTALFWGERYYCGKCKKPYQRETNYPENGLTHKRRFFAEVEVTKDGVPITKK